MSAHPDRDLALPVVGDSGLFNARSGNRLERLIFNFRAWVVLACVLATVVLAWKGSTLELNASFERILPVSHPYIRNYLDNRHDLRALGNVLRVSVESRRGDIFDVAYLETLRAINDELFLTPGVDRAWMKSLWTPFVRWNEVTEEGFTGGPVMPDRFDGSPAAIAQLRANIARAGILGSLVARDFKSSVIVVPLLDKDSDSGRRLDYGKLSSTIEERIRQRFAGAPDASVQVHVIGFAKLVGDLIAGVLQMASFFGAAFIIAALLIYAHTRCLRSTALLLVCSLVAVIWQLGAIALLGYELDPYSVLVPFLVFAIGVSHGAQKMNGIKQDVARGTHRYVAARYTFRRLFLPGLTALLADAVAFAVLMFIDIPAIRELALIASLGVAILIFTNLILLPVLLSYVGVSTTAADARAVDAAQGGRMVTLLTRFTERRWATAALAASVALTAGGLILSRQLTIGDIQPGAPELRADSRYNRDVAFFNAHYGLSSDQFAIIVKTPPSGCERYETLVDVDRLAWTLQQVDGVQSAVSLADPIQGFTAGSNEGNPKWLTVSRSQDVINFGSRSASMSNPDLMTLNCEVTPVIAFLRDHKAATLQRVLQASEDFAREHERDNVRFLPVAGSAGIEAVTNLVVEQANTRMLWYVYASVVLLCLVTFRSWRAVLVAVIPLAITSVLCEALMVLLGIGVKVATLPVVALGVGIGVDYALYILSIQLARQRSGQSLADAYRTALGFTGKVVALVGVTLAAGVFTWAFSPIKFQADMGILLSFMFIWNMVGALVLIPALSHFLLPSARPLNQVEPAVVPAA